MSRIDSRHWKISTGCHFQNGHHNTAQTQHCPISTPFYMSRIDSWHRKISTGRHFQNGHHNTAQIQHCSISASWIDSRHQKISTKMAAMTSDWLSNWQFLKLFFRNTVLKESKFYLNYSLGGPLPKWCPSIIQDSCHSWLCNFWFFSII